MCSPVGRCFCFCLVLFFKISGVSPGGVVFGVVPAGGVELSPGWGGLFSSCLSPVGAMVGVPGRVFFLHYTTVYCAYLSVVLVPFRSW